LTWERSSKALKVLGASISHSFSAAHAALLSFHIKQCDHYHGTTMETLNGTSWDVVISGTGLPQSLLALYVCLAVGTQTQAD
jgi:hypothetical protein